MLGVEPKRRACRRMLEELKGEPRGNISSVAMSGMPAIAKCSCSVNLGEAFTSGKRIMRYRRSSRSERLILRAGRVGRARGVREQDAGEKKGKIHTGTRTHVHGTAHAGAEQRSMSPSRLYDHDHDASTAAVTLELK